MVSSIKKSKGISGQILPTASLLFENVFSIPYIRTFCDMLFGNYGLISVLTLPVICSAKHRNRCCWRSSFLNYEFVYILTLLGVYVILFSREGANQ